MIPLQYPKHITDKISQQLIFIVPRHVHRHSETNQIIPKEIKSLKKL